MWLKTVAIPPNKTLMITMCATSVMFVTVAAPRKQCQQPITPSTLCTVHGVDDIYAKYIMYSAWCGRHIRQVHYVQCMVWTTYTPSTLCTVHGVDDIYAKYIMYSAWCGRHIRQVHYVQCMVWTTYTPSTLCTVHGVDDIKVDIMVMYRFAR